jgi:D-tyrosyl-tRNA(Tyr) deacylase
VRIVVQRVAEAQVSVADKTIGSISRGLLLLVGIGRGDGEVDLRKLAGQIVELRIFSDVSGKMNLSLRDVGGEALVVSQFTLCADVRRGRRPSFTDAAPPGEAESLLEAFVSALRAEGIPVRTGIFGAKMTVRLTNDGPVTFVLDVAAGRTRE